METKAVLFDLDGTLLPMDQERFTKTYFQLLAAKLAPLGYDPAKLVDSIWARKPPHWYRNHRFSPWFLYQ